MKTTIHLVSLGIVIFGVFGCGGLFGNGGGRARALPPATGGVAGTLARDAGGAVAFVYDNLPAGSTPVADATVSVAQGGAAKTGADGKFVLPKVTFGHKTLHVLIPGSAGLDVPLTVIPDAVIQLGDPPVKRDQAIAAARSWIAGQVDVATVDIYAPQQPIPTGVKLQSSVHFDAPAPLYTAASPQWLIYCDVYPTARFAHDVYVVFVDAQTGAVNPLTSDCYPSLNDAGFYSKPTTQNAPDTVSTATRSKPATGHAARRILPISRGRDHVDDPNHTGRTFALVIGGRDDDGPRPDMDADVANAGKLFGNAALPPLGKITVYDADQEFDQWWQKTPAPHDYPLGNYPDKSKIIPSLTASIQAKLDQIFAGLKSMDTFVLYVSSHGTNFAGYEFYVPFTMRANAEKDAAGNVVRDQQGISYENYYDKIGGISMKSLDFSRCKACHIVIIADTCRSHNMVDDMTPVFQGSTGKEVVLLGAAAGTANGTFEVQKTYTTTTGSFTLPQGGAFSAGLIKALSDPTLAGGLYAGLTSAVSQAAIPTQAIWNEAPHMWTRTVADGEFCETGSDTITIRSKEIRR